MEQTGWQPGLWTETKIKQTVKHIFNHAFKELALLVGPYQGNLLLAEMKGYLRAEKSKIELHKMNIRLRGDN